MSRYIQDLFKKIREWDIGYIYLVKAGDYFKVGTSTLPEQRIQLIRTDNPIETEVLYLGKTHSMNEVEKMVHDWLKEDGYHIRGEWFRYSEEIANLVIKELQSINSDVTNPEVLELLKAH